MARVGLAHFYRWVKVKPPYRVIVEDGRIALMLSGNFRTFTWSRWNTGFSFAAETSQRLIHIVSREKTCHCILTDCSGDKFVQSLITDLAQLKMVYSEFLN